MQVQMLQGGDLGQRAHSAIPHSAASRQRQPLQPRQRLQSKHPCVADLRRTHTSHQPATPFHHGCMRQQCTWAGVGSDRSPHQVLIMLSCASAGLPLEALSVSCSCNRGMYAGVDQLPQLVCKCRWKLP